jgi:hypothetical protein
MDWTAGAAKTLVVLGDAAPHSPAVVPHFLFSIISSIFTNFYKGIYANERQQYQTPSQN